MSRTDVSQRPGHTDHDQNQTLTSPTSHPSQPIATFSRQISAQSVPLLRGGVGNNSDISTRDDVFYEEHEERPIATTEDMSLQASPITRITASPLPRRSRRLSRLVFPHSNVDGGLEEDNQAHSDGRSHMQLSNPDPTRSVYSEHSRLSRPTSILSSMNPWARRPRERAPISQPFPLSPDASPPPSGLATYSLRESLWGRNPSTGAPNNTSRIRPLRDSSRLSRVRRSISSPFEAFSSTAQSSPLQHPIVQAPPQRPMRARPLSAYEPGFRNPPLDDTTASINVLRENLDAQSLPNRESDTQSAETTSEGHERSIPQSEGPNLLERWTERNSSGRREGRRMSNMLRGRSSRIVRRENDGPLPRILQLAATAIATQLAGTGEQPVPAMHPIGPDDLNGSLHNLFRTLQSASITSENSRMPDDDREPSGAAGTLPPLNFLRVFRFVNQNSNASSHPVRPRNSRSNRRSGSEGAPTIEEDSVEDPEERTVTLVLVGVRSVPSDRVGQEDTIGLERPSLEALLNLPTPAPSGNLLRNGASGLLRNANGRSRFPHRRRASMGGLNTFTSNYDSQRHQRTLSNASPQELGETTPITGTVTPVVFSDSPPGPHPPPSTPAEPAMSAHSSIPNTPSRRTSSASTMQQSPLPSRDIATQHLREAGILTSEDQASRVHHRPRSESEFARHRDLGAGAARRNGVVEPDEIENGETTGPRSRSWLIYVVGTNLSEDHPALTTPSLFTDNPTYEDMMLLSSLLGPVKPPVASREDVASASGIYRVQTLSEGLVAAAVQGIGQLRIIPGERCLVCLEDYQVEEELRQLTKCSHLFHRGCIDEWLTTGRNSCPLCRGQGVDERKGSQSESPQSAVGPSRVNI
ncbi:hypothetical protein MMC21_004367 [Puttea exsequens]|nr:hypothetical protein [Puttea exsequens]